LSHVATGLVSQELSRGDASVATFFGVQSGLAMAAIYACGSEEQRQRWLPPMARLEVIGAFGLTEPNVGSDAGHPETRAHRDGDAWVLEGAKRWIGNASIADVTIIWARDDDGHVGGFLVERNTPGFSVANITGKLAQRAVWQTDIALRECRIPLENRLAQATTFRAASGVLMAARTGVAWGALGHAMACYEAALAYTTRRQQFGKPVAAFQLVQEKLVRMLAAVTRGQLMCLRVSQLVDAGKLSHAAASLAKFSVARDAREVAQLARDLMGGNGILLENHVARHMADLEAVFTYEGTDHINALVVGREITGLNAFV
jgi:glutaryl-CoA dehydrogenase